MKGTCTAAGRVAPTPCSVSLYMFILCFCFIFKPLSNRKDRITRSSVSGNSTSSAGVSYIVGGGRQLLVGGNMCLWRQHVPSAAMLSSAVILSPSLTSIVLGIRAPSNIKSISHNIFL